jgi:ubiquinone/menaquinone biosynthesis C-methylase UbiE
MLNLNIGCGLTHLDGFVNIDKDPGVIPDYVLDVTQGLGKYDTESVSRIYFSHTIEHIPEKFHVPILEEFWRVLKPKGFLFISYPEFVLCAKNYIDNFLGMRDYWKATVYGRQLSPEDFHCALMDTPQVIRQLKETGFSPVFNSSEPNHSYNTIIKAFKGEKMPTYEDVIAREVFNATSAASG